MKISSKRKHYIELNSQEMKDLQNLLKLAQETIETNKINGYNWVLLDVLLKEECDC